MVPAFRKKQELDGEEWLQASGIAWFNDDIISISSGIEGAGE